ncbi:MAG: glycine C-acetyltransferase [Spirochaetaceae bacterium]|nr:MAG: glycine C-acetyltransferase [Spirochaetaceae bacterium]
MYSSMKAILDSELNHIRNAGLYKDERVVTTRQSSRIGVADGREVLNLCANNYLGLSSDSRIVAAAHDALDRWGYGLSSVRFICGTTAVHTELEQKIAHFLGTDDAILYSSCFDANGGLFETLLGPDDAVISDALNHASIIDGIRLCKAKRSVYANNDMADLEEKLVAAADARIRLVATDGVFSMDGTYARLNEICDLAEKYNALVMVDDSHAVGFVGATGRGTHERACVEGRIDIITGTLGKALGGASGGYTAARAEIVELLRQRSRPYLFSNSVAPMIVAASIAALELIEESSTLRDTLEANTRFFRSKLAGIGLDVLDGDHPIVPIMIGDAAEAHRIAAEMLKRGVYVVGFSYPVVPNGAARIRTQVSAAHTRDELSEAVRCFAEVIGRSGRRTP